MVSRLIQKIWNRTIDIKYEISSFLLISDKITSYLRLCLFLFSAMDLHFINVYAAFEFLPMDKIDDNVQRYRENMMHPKYVSNNFCTLFLYMTNQILFTSCNPWLAFFSSFLLDTLIYILVGVRLFWWISQSILLLPTWFLW